MAKNLIFSKDLYISESMKDENLDTLKEGLLESPLFTKAFLITISSNPTEQLDIYEAKYLAFPFYDTHLTYVVGLAGSNSEAVSLVQKIAQECYENRGDGNVRAYLMEYKLTEK